jgi:hypothetical protein
MHITWVEVGEFSSSYVDALPTEEKSGRIVLLPEKVGVDA